MGLKYDVELFCADIASILSANLNNKLASIDAEKNDGIVLKQVTADAYFFQELNNKVANYNPFILYGVEAMPTVSVEGSSAKIITASIVIVLSDDGTDSDIPIRLLRYSRAFDEIFQENYTLFKNSVKLKILNLMPVQFNLMNSSLNYRAVGINLTGSFA